MHYYQHHIGDYLSHTANLSLLEHGVYLRLLHCYYMAEGPLAGDIYRMIGARTQEEKQAVDYVLETFFVPDDSGYRQQGADKRIAQFKEKSDKARKAVELRWHNERNTDVSDLHTDVSNSDTNAILTNNHKPITNNQLISSVPSVAVAPVKQSAGTRLPADWQLPSDWQQEAVEIGVEHFQTFVEAEKFRDYWHSVAGAKGRKADWKATWRNWARRSLENAQRNQSHAERKHAFAEHKARRDFSRATPETF